MSRYAGNFGNQSRAIVLCEREYAIVVIQRFALKIHLCHQAVGGTCNLEMDVWRAHAAGPVISIRSRLDRREAVRAVGVAFERGVTLKIGVALTIALVAWMGVAPVRVGLPDFDFDAWHRPTRLIEYASRNTKDLASSASGSAYYGRQVGVLIAWLQDRIIGTKYLPGRAPELLRERGNDSQRSRS